MPPTTTAPLLFIQFRLFHFSTFRLSDFRRLDRLLGIVRLGLFFFMTLGGGGKRGKRDGFDVTRHSRH